MDRDTTEGQDSVFCAWKCSKWVHHQCAALSIKMLDKSDEPYICPKCESEFATLQSDKNKSPPPLDCLRLGKYRPILL